jgi:hypothetical protein
MNGKYRGNRRTEVTHRATIRARELPTATKTGFRGQMTYQHTVAILGLFALPSTTFEQRPERFLVDFSRWTQG